MISKTWSKKAPSQNPVDFYQSKQQGGTNGSQSKPQSVPDKLSGGPMREQIFGRKNLGDSK